MSTAMNTDTEPSTTTNTIAELADTQVPAETVEVHKRPSKSNVTKVINQDLASLKDRKLKDPAVLVNLPDSPAPHDLEVAQDYFDEEVQ